MSALCNVCSKPDGFRCGQCRDVFYCSKECQKSDWKAHKKLCFPPDSTCTRCLEPTTSNDGLCCVGHPEFYLQDTGKSFSREGMQMGFNCSACTRSFKKWKPRNEREFTIYPPQFRWCFQGPHTIKPIKEGDNRRVHHDVVYVGVTEDDTTASVQAKIHQFDAATVRILCIEASDGMFPEDSKPILDVTMPLLEEVKIIDVNFQKIVFNASKTPKLRNIEMQNIPDECSIEIKCPTLTHVDFRHHHGTCEWVQDMLDTAQKLVSFQSYKLGVQHISFASPELREIVVHRSDICYKVSVWAPRLMRLRLQACYGLEELEFPSEHPSFTSTDELSTFSVDTTNSILSNEAVGVLSSNPRVQWDGPDQDSDYF